MTRGWRRSARCAPASPEGEAELRRQARPGEGSARRGRGRLLRTGRKPLTRSLRDSTSPFGRGGARLCTAGRTLYMRPASQKDLRMPATSVLDLIGNTPLVEVTRFDTGPCRLFLKLESQNPGGSIKDRIGAVDDRGRRARRALAAGRHDRRGDRRQHRPRPRAGRRRARATALILVVPDKMWREKILHLRALGAEVRITRSRRRQGPPRLLPGHGRAHRRARRPAPSTSTSSPTRPTRGARDDDRPGDPGRRWAATSTRWWSASAPAARSPASARFFAQRLAEDRDGARRSGRLDPRAATSRPARSWARPAPGWSKASARISCRRSADLSR